MRRHSSAKSRQRPARYNAFDVMAPPTEKTVPDVLYIGYGHRKSVGPVFVPDRPFTRSRVIPDFQSHIRERNRRCVRRLSDVDYALSASADSCLTRWGNLS